MAIIVEQDKKPVNFLGIISTIVIIAVLFIGGYFVFFKKPELIEIVSPNNLGNLDELSKINFDPSEVLNSQTFKLLRQFAVGVPNLTPGRINPFKPF